MTTDEARVIICGSITQIFRENGNKLLKEALEVAIAALEQPDGQSLLEKVRKYLKETPREQVLADWDATSHIKGGITVDEYLASLQPAPVKEGGINGK